MMVKKSDPYLKQIYKYWNEIISMYLSFKNRKPIIEFNPNRIRIIAYPAKEYLEGLSDRTREDAKRPIMKQAWLIQSCFLSAMKRGCHVSISDY